MSRPKQTPYFGQKAKLSPSLSFSQSLLKNPWLLVVFILFVYLNLFCKILKSLTYSLFIVRQFSYLSYVIEFKYTFMPGAVLGADDTNSIKAWGVWSRRRRGQTGWSCLKLLIVHTHHLQIARHSSMSEWTFPNTSMVIIFNHTLPTAFQ